MQEDEIAVNILASGTSPYCAIVLPREESSRLRQYYTFEGASEGELKSWQSSFYWFMKKVTLHHSLKAHDQVNSPSTNSDLQAHHKTKGSTSNSAGASTSATGASATNSSARGPSSRAAAGQDLGQSPKPLLIKSPVHTARLRMWLSMFPKAKFIYIHRHPIEVCVLCATSGVAQSHSEVFCWYVTYLYYAARHVL